MNRSELVMALREAAEGAVRETHWNYDTIQNTANEAVARSLRAVADILEVGNEA